MEISIQSSHTCISQSSIHSRIQWLSMLLHCFTWHARICFSHSIQSQSLLS